MIGMRLQKENSCCYGLVVYWICLVIKKVMDGGCLVNIRKSVFRYMQLLSSVKAVGGADFGNKIRSSLFIDDTV